MLPPLFYASQNAVEADSIVLPADESRHAIQVLRLQRGDTVIVIDGAGTAYRRHISNVMARKKLVHVDIRDTIRNFGEPAVKLTLAAGMSTGQKLDKVVEKGTEIGVTRFVPVLTSKSRMRVDDSGKVRNKKARLERVALAAAKQARRAYRPDISLPISLNDFLAESDRDSLNVIFHPDNSGVPLDELPLEPTPRRISVLVGPESGFSPEEVMQARGAGFRVVHLGRRILRSETAGLLAAALVFFRLGELK